MKYFKLSKIKSFNEEKKIEFAPINLLIGPNGSGKSSLINGLLLSKTIINNQTARISSGWQFINGKLNNASEIFPKSYNKIQLNNRISNPTKNNFVFNEKYINLNSKKREFSLAFPIELSFFPDNFELKITYSLDKLNNSNIKSLEVYNATIKKPLFSIKSQELTDSVTTELFFNTTPNSNKADYEDIVYKIDLNYIIKFLETTKKAIEEKPKNKSKLGGELKDPPLDALLYIEEVQKKENEEFQASFFNGFYETKISWLNTENGSSKSFDPQIYSLYKPLESQNFFEFTKIGDDDLDSFNEKTKNALLFEMEQQWIEKLKNGIAIPYEKNNLSNHFNSSINGDTPIISSDVFELLGIDKLSMLNLKCEGTSKLRFVIYTLLFENINNALYNLQGLIKEIIYVPPYRISNKQLMASDIDVVTLIKDKLIALQYYNGWEEPADFFVNYWLKEFGIHEKIKFNSTSSVLEFLDENMASGKSNLVELGFGINQLIPLICLVSLDFHDSHKRKDDFTDFQRNLFLIEEPEANLHPSFQSKLADMFIDCASKFGHQFLIETHSEYMVRKFQYWVAKGRIKPEDVNIYYFDNKNHDPAIKDVVIKRINILRDGSLSEPFGNGFFDEATNLQFELLKIKNAQKN
jgi:predicted ATPase